MAMSQEDLARMVVSLEAQSAKFLKQLQRSRRETARWKTKVNNQVKSVATSFKNLAGAAGLALFTRNIIQNTIKQERAVNQLQRGWETTAGVVGMSVDEMIKEAGRLQDATIFGDEAIIEAQSQLITFTNITGEQFRKTTEAALDLSTRMGTDLKSSIVQLGKALNDPVANLSALSRSGIQFTDQQKEQVKVLVESNRMMEAQDIILKELQSQFGGSARAARDTFGGALQGLSNAFGDLLEGTNGNGGLTGSKVAVEELTSLLQDPQTKAAAEAFTGGLIAGLGSVVDLAVRIVNSIREMSRSIARLVSGNRRTLTEQREDVLDRLESMNDIIGNDIFSAEQQTLAVDRARELLRELKVIDDTLELLGQKADFNPDGATLPGSGVSNTGGGVIPEISSEELQQRFEQLQQGLLTEEEAWQESFRKRMETIDAFEAASTENVALAADARTRLLKEQSDRQLKQEKKIADARMDVQKKVLDVGIALAKDGSKAERALLAIKKAIALKESILNLQSAMGEALATPWPANIAAIGQVAAIGGGILANIKGTDVSVPSFLGGGFTGNGARIGGLDGQGGMPAIVHPNEQVIDMKRGGGPTIVQHIDIDARGADPGVLGNIEAALERSRLQTIAEMKQMQAQGL